MKLQIKTTFDFGKLENQIEDIIKNTTEGITKAGTSGIKQSLETGKFEPLSKTTIEIREKGESPNAGYLATGSTKPLIHTGRLRDSIKTTSDGIKMLKYGVYHNEGYKTKHNKFTGNYFKRTGVQLANQSVPSRPFIDRGLLIETKESKLAFKNFSKALKRSLRK